MRGSLRAPHTAFFHTSEDAHAAAVADFVGAGLPHGERSLVITPPEQWKKIAGRLDESGVDGTEAEHRGAILVVDPATIIEQTVVNGIFDRARYFLALQDILTGRHPPRRMFGDAAGRLAAQGNMSAALALEGAIADLVASHPMDVLCGHDVRQFAEPNHDWQIRSVINAHEHSVTDPGVNPEVVPLNAARRTARNAELILLWDDYADSRLMYAEALTFGGYRVIAAEDAGEALTLGQAYSPDLIILDVRLPSSVAAATLRSLKNSRRSIPPVLALTAHAFEAERDGIAREGFDAVLSKPCLPDALVGAVTRALEGRAPDRTS